MKNLHLILCFIFALGNANAALINDTPGDTLGDGTAAGASAPSDAASTFSMYDGFKYGDSMNWGDCFDDKTRPGVDVCIKYTPFGPVVYPTLTTEYSYNDPVALVEVVPDPWRSFLYKESMFDFSNRADDAILDRVGASSTIGSGYGNQKTAGGGKEFIGKHRYESHVWAISDWWRLNTSDKGKACFSLSCKNEDLTGCYLGVIKAMAKKARGIQQTAANINTGQISEGKGQGFENAETEEVVHENGEVQEPVRDDKGRKTGEYKTTREPGNYGGGGFIGKAAEVAMADSPIPGMSNAEMVMDGIALAKDPEGYVKGKAISIGTDYAMEMYEESALKDKIEAAKEGAVKQDSKPSSEVTPGVQGNKLPGDTAKGGVKQEEPKPLSNTGDSSTGKNYDSTGKDSSEVGNDTMSNAMGTNNAGNTQALDQIESRVAGAAADFGSGAFTQAVSYIDRVVYFNTVELMIQMIARVMPVYIYPVYMTEYHEKASADGGFFFAPLFQKFAQMGAGLVMPIFCMSSTLGMGVDAVGVMFVGEGFSILDKLGPVGAFIKGRCVGSWGPLEPRVTMLGTGDPFVAAGLASVRSLNIAQSVTGSMFNQTINNKPYSELKFNLDWPHQSNCYSISGPDGLSRAWTTPLGGALDSVTSAVKSGDMTAIAKSATNATVAPVKKQGGYIFTYWMHRRCQYKWACKEWHGHTGI